MISPSSEKIAKAMLDITKPQAVEVIIDDNRNVLHVNVDGICILRICQSDTSITLERR